jgi:hypothetical protein
MRTITLPAGSTGRNIGFLWLGRFICIYFTINQITRLLDNANIPFDPDNTDYQRFKRDLAQGVALMDATGTPMTADQITEFLQGLA